MKPGPKCDDDPILRALAVGMTAREVALSTGVAESTVYKRLRDPLFNARLHEYRAQELKPCADNMTKEIAKSLDFLVSLRDDPTASEKGRVAATKTILESGLKLRQEVYILPRLAALEAALAEKGIDLPLPVGPAAELLKPDIGGE